MYHVTWEDCLTMVGWLCFQGQIEPKIATLEVDTASGFKHSQKKLSSLDLNLEQRLESFISGFRDEVQLLQFRFVYLKVER